MSVMQVEFTEETKAALERSAQMTGRAPESLVVEAVHRFLDIERWQVEEIKKGLEEADDGDFASDEEVRAFFARWQLDAP